MDDPNPGQGNAWGDYDNDGNLDLYLVNVNSANRLYQNNGDGTFNEIGAAAGVNDNTTGSGVTAGDYDGAGDLDLQFGRNFPSSNLPYNNDGNSNHWLHVKLIGTISNQDGLGASVIALRCPLAYLPTCTTSFTTSIRTDFE